MLGDSGLLNLGCTGIPMSLTWTWVNLHGLRTRLTSSTTVLGKSCRDLG